MQIKLKNIYMLLRNLWAFTSALPSLLQADAESSHALPIVGGQAVMEGVIMRNGAAYALAVRRSNGHIHLEKHPWRSAAPNGWRKIPFLRGFPTLIETLINGIKALNRSAALYEFNDSESPASSNTISSWQLYGSLVLAFFVAVLLFVAAPHILASAMQYFGFGGEMSGFSFHLWDGIFKFIIFILYLFLISFLSDIDRVFRYHGAEHKTVHAFENGYRVTVNTVRSCSRFHPRCGTTFLLFVLSVSILLHAVFVPLLLLFWTPESVVLKHFGVIVFKIFLIIPVSAVAYEIIKYSSAKSGKICSLLRSPGLFFQHLTTREPDSNQIEVAIVALQGALSGEDRFNGRFENIPSLERE